MGKPAAKQNDLAVGIDTHIVMVPAGTSLVPTPLPHPFSGPLDTNLSPTVKIDGLPAAVLGSIAHNMPPHIPTPPGVSFQRPPSNQGSVSMASTTVKINGKPAARIGDPVTTCNDPADAPTCHIVGASTVMIGG
ncbi:hypothetical protein F8S13_06985 [Chloroflexia bacterium SDU3-3]|nr:hypothetical protein F8S13_06985 [Chloroflexia bacterium SDU3-3]